MHVSYDDCASQTQLLRLAISESKSSNLSYPPAGCPDKEDCRHCGVLNCLLKVSVKYAYQEISKRYFLCSYDFQALKS